MNEVPTVSNELLTDVATLAIPVVKKVVLFTEEFTVLFPTETKTVVIFTLDPTLAPVLKLAMLVDNTEELT